MTTNTARRTRRIAWATAVSLWSFAFIMNIVWPGWNWGVMDFVFAAVYFSVGAGTVDWLSRRNFTPLQRRMLITTVVLVMMAIWARLATGD